MIGHNELTVGGKVLHRWLAVRRGTLARELVEHFAATVADYRQLPSDELADDIVAATEENLRVFAEVLRSGELPTPAALAGPITESAARRADEGMPLQAVLHAYGLGMTGAWKAMTASATADDLPHVLACTELVLGYVQRVTGAVATAYLEERRRISTHDQDTKHVLLATLLRGDPAEEAARRADITLPEQYLVLTIELAPHRDELDPSVGTAIAIRRKLHRVQRELEQYADAATLSLLDTAGGTVLVPSADETTSPSGLVSRMRAAAGVDIIAAFAVAPPAEVAVLVRQTREVLELAKTFGKGPGLYQLDDVLLEYQLTRPTEAAEALSRQLAPLDVHPELLHTLESFVRNGLNRRRTAAELHIHANTVDYRLRKTIALTGLDPGEPAGLQRIGAALAIRRRRAGT
ncbi:hypothetical protein BAY61_29635 [Prauserella marina]|uniref:DNA-binding transcriptional regulator, PucR family n=1 Tax=Prauserella marina TaxID=530584 RepID=A0A222VX30_9PSEU|nr:helix-turn-helix domain-containing protein [Prauserella marina]ASR38475.1 hypothetical protein BAY61_29635 [Prauserella marina]PWV78280.1 DNA-binding PucR family transcriptional regulator [Prauserella marina]SDC82476.1 DNA-binding transcriptional regulator, PucR family [Prauserella marina]